MTKPQSRPCYDALPTIKARFFLRHLLPSLSLANNQRSLNRLGKPHIEETECKESHRSAILLAAHSGVQSNGHASPYHATLHLLDKDSIEREATEYSKSGTDDASAGQDDAAFDPDVTDPEEQKNKVGDKTGDVKDERDDIDWRRGLEKLVHFEKTLKVSNDQIKVPQLAEIVNCVEYLLEHAAVDLSSSNVAFLKSLFESPKNHDLLCNSSVFAWARKANSLSGGWSEGYLSCTDGPVRSISPISTSDLDSREYGHGGQGVDRSMSNGPEIRADAVCFFGAHSEYRQLSAKLHCLYGVPVQVLPRSSSNTHHNLRANKGVKLHPFARSLVYDLRQHSEHSLWGPFHRDGSEKIDWEKIECLMMILSYNIHYFADRYSAHGLALVPPWDEPFTGATPYSINLPPWRPEIGRPPTVPIELRDPYNVTGVWMRVVCFLDYRELFTFNFSENQPLPSQSRPPIDVEEAIRFIVVKLHATSIEQPGEDDGQALPIVHFKGISSSALPPVDPNANSKIRGTVKLTPQGDVRWTTLSVFHGEERWRSEGIQIGGVQSARGIIGFWFDKDFDPYGPAGPTAFWKVSNDPHEDAFNMEEG
ncbi:MAG: hypothetical protein Q9211_005463 [Gyalolechia sp. 1 TL-2023]